ncbi:hypothetical protein AUR63_07865 [Guyparkeria sp. XI15]|nr:hypothetical protein AUR63_07865 [Guyparkeria sp. XI15]OAE88375.1 hypothetical protein AWR35_07880 [Guyparkeria sp. WRN-7]
MLEIECFLMRLVKFYVLAGILMIFTFQLSIRPLTRFLGIPKSLMQSLFTCQPTLELKYC